jgi:hypothetical protein
MQFCSPLPRALISGLSSTMFLPNLVSQFLTATSIFTHPHLTPRSSKALLRLDSSNEFHIAIFSDLHYGEDEDGWGITQDVNSTWVMNNILDAEDPDFVILSKIISLISFPIPVIT